MPPTQERATMRDARGRHAVRQPPSGALVHGRAGHPGAAPGDLRRGAGERHPAARARPRRLARSLPADHPRGAHRARRRGPGHPRAQPRRQRGHPRGGVGHRRLPRALDPRGCRRTPVAGGLPGAARPGAVDPRGLHVGGPRGRVVPGAQRAPPVLPRLAGGPDRQRPAGEHGRHPHGRAQAGARAGGPDPAQRPRPGRVPHRPRAAARGRRHPRGHGVPVPAPGRRRDARSSRHFSSPERLCPCASLPG